MEPSRILLVDDEPELLLIVKETLQREGYSVATAGNWRDAEEVARQALFDLFILDYKMPEVNGIELMKRLRRIVPTAEAMIITGYGTIENGVEAIRQGARDFATKPVERYELVHRVQTILERRHLRLSLRQKENELKDRYCFEKIVGPSAGMAEVRDLAARASAVLSSVLIQGESGTGKELVARAIHYASDRCKGPFVAVNCGAIAPTIAEREFFGHEKGAFTGAGNQGVGYFEAAEDGTLFLDEVGELPLSLQVKLLRTLDNHEMLRVGGSEAIPVNARILFATNRDLEEMVAKGTFRHDLYYRINVLRVEIPPLRERREDVPGLATEFLSRCAERMGVPPKIIPEDTMMALEEYHWPGNARELQNVIERAVALSRGSEIELEYLPGWVLREDAEEAGEGMAASVSGSADFMAARRQALERFDRQFITHLLKENENNVSQAAKAAGLARTALQRYMRKYGIKRIDALG